MDKILKYFIFMFCIFIFFGCGGKDIDIPKDDNNFYGIGNGKTLQEAKDNAISSLAMAIKSNVKISLDSYIHDSNNHISTLNIQNSNITSNLSNIQNIQIEKILQNKEISILVKLNKLDFAKQLLVKIKSEKNIIKNAIGECKYPALNRSHEIKNTATELSNNILLLSGIKKTNVPINDYTYLENTNPSFNVIFDDNAKKLQDVINVELSKFINIHSQSNMKIFVKLKKNAHNYSIFLNFYNCMNQNDLNLEVLSDDDNLQSSYAKKRIGVKIYKMLREAH